MQQLDLADVRDRLKQALERERIEEVPRYARQLPASELEDLLPALDTRRLGVLFRAMGDEWLADLVAELDPTIAARLLVRLTDAQAADVLEEMPPDEAADVVGELDPVDREEVLREMEREEATDIRGLLEYRPETAGGRMTPAFVALQEGMSADEAVRYLRGVGEDAEIVYYVYVVDGQGRLAGVTTLHDLVLSPPERKVSEITNRDVVAVRASDDQEVAARLLREHGFLALPVIAPDRRLLGVITADDVAAVLEEEASEDIARLGGSQPLDEPYLSAGLGHLFRKRVIWLLVLFAASGYTATVLQHFEGEMTQVVALAFFIPLLIGTGGNTGSQVVTMLVRAIAVGEVRLRDLVRVFWREVAVGAMLGSVMALAAYARAWTMGVGPELGSVVALTAFAVVVWAAVVAAVLPLFLARLRIDPAVASGPLIATLVDGTGLVIYFTIAQAVLRI